MAECSIARCSQERRIFRKELQKWSKEVLYVLGLERIAEELMGTRKWNILTQPFTDLETETSDDWYPEDVCYFCNAKKLPPYDPASGIIPTVDGYNALRIDTDEHSTSSDQGTAPGSFTSCSSALSPWYASALSSHGVSGSSPPLHDQPLDLSVSSMRQSVEDLNIFPGCKSLSSPAKNVYNSESHANSVIKVPQLPLKSGNRRRLDGNSKRTYTEEELQAALRDIQSGKLGTRRAAVIYGIPRSTLRNKVYKLANESKSRAHNRVVSNTTPPKPKDQNSSVVNVNKTELEVPTFVSSNCTKQTNSSTSSASDSLRQLLKHTITQKAQHVAKNSEIRVSNVDENPQQYVNSETVAALHMLGSLECSQSLAPVLSHVFGDIQNLALGKSKENSHSISQSLNALKDDIKLPMLPDLIRRLAEERMEIERDRLKDCKAHDKETPTEEVVNSTTSSLSNVILKVPSYKPAKSPPASSSDTPDPSIPVTHSSPVSPGTSSSSQNISGNKGIGVSLKELIARSISQKVNTKQEEKADPPAKQHVLPSVSSNSTSSMPPWILGGSAQHSPKENSSLTNATNSSNSSDSSKSEKRTRPKRGRYRNYDRDNLARAVRAVQRGEMSVHRAGTFYGVPHSTLEYKVKERHLLRPRKRDLLHSASAADSSETAATTTTASSSSSAAAAASKPCPHSKGVTNSGSKFSKNHVGQNSEPPNGFKTNPELNHRPSLGSFPSHLSLWQSMPFFSLDFTQLGSNNFFASQMMRKLQENARLHEENQRKRKNQELGILESLIKSTLDRSMSPERKSSLFFPTEPVLALSDKQSSGTVSGK